MFTLQDKKLFFGSPSNLFWMTGLCSSRHSNLFWMTGLCSIRHSNLFWMTGLCSSRHTNQIQQQHHYQQLQQVQRQQQQATKFEHHQTILDPSFPQQPPSQLVWTTETTVLNSSWLEQHWQLVWTAEPRTKITNNIVAITGYKRWRVKARAWPEPE